jgi:hypothetical protein
MVIGEKHTIDLFFCVDHKVYNGKCDFLKA